TFTYHNLSHTLYVVKAAEMIATSMNIESRQKKILLVAAWFHDVGYTQQIDNHETAGAVIAEKFLLEKNVDSEDIETVKSCILSTHYPQKPDSILESILCDADMMHLSDKAFIDVGVSLRMEWELTKARKFTDEEWYDLNIQFVSAHKYHTSFAIKNLESHKNKNLKKLSSRLNAVDGKTATDKDKELMTIDKSKKNKEKLERGVETLFRTASSNHMKLSGMADNKAHILLSINSIIISIILSVLAKKLTDATYLVIPTILLLCISVITIVFAVLTTKPKISKGVFTREQITKREVNLLFFGNFHQMDLVNYEWAIQEMMHDKEYLYKSMTKDIYFLGKILARKYHYLNIGYRIFMYGLLSSVVAYAISFFMATHAVLP
ncbi:MAG TPA: Pycsar system effector family protein, partial [Chitinophagaceae bacterium]|nr:Pycsar system effector family protein [Chitinophagaceae bacterium]